MGLIKTVELPSFALVWTMPHGVRSETHIVLPLVDWPEDNLVS